MHRCSIVSYMVGCFVFASQALAATKTCDAPIDATASVGHPNRITVAVDGNDEKRACYFIVDGIGPDDMLQAFFNDDPGFMGDAIADSFESLSDEEGQSDLLRGEDFSQAVYDCFAMAFEMQNEQKFFHLNAEFDITPTEVELSCFLLGGEGSTNLGGFNEILDGYGSIGFVLPELIYVRQKVESPGKQLVFLPIVPEE